MVSSQPVASTSSLAEPLSSAQRRFWFLHRLAPGGHAHQLSAGVRLRGALDAAALTAALRDLLDRHEILRTAYPADTTGEPSARVLDAPAADLLTVAHRELPSEPDLAADTDADLVDPAAPAADGPLGTVLAEFGRQPIDITDGIPLRAQVVRVAPDDHVLQLVIARVAADETSWRVLFTDLAACYQARRRGARPGPTGGGARYADHARREATAEHRAEADRQVAWWRQVLTPLPPLLTPALASVGPDGSPPGGGADDVPGANDVPDADQPAPRARVALAPDVTRRLRAFAAAHETSLADVVLAAGAVLLHRSTGEADIALGLPVTDRPTPGFAGVAGNFGSLVVVRVRVDARGTAGELVDEIRVRAAAARARIAAPFDEVVRAARGSGPGSGRAIVADPSRARRPGATRGRRGPGALGGGLVDVTFSHHEPLLGGVAFAGLATEELRPPGGPATVPLDLAVQDDGDTVAVSATVDAAVFTAADAERFAGRLARLAEQFTDGALLGELDTMSAAERRQVLDDWSTGRVEPLVDRSLTELVADAARRAPQAVAVVALPAAPPPGQPSPPAVSLTYAELERRADAVAGWLRTAGVGPEATVGVSVPRSAALVVALLGVLRAGGAFVPLEPSWPARRTAEVAGDAAIATIIAGADVTVPELPGAPPVIRLDATGHPVADGPAGGPAPAAGGIADAGVDGENLAFVTYTSGSTGAPKGVMIRHQAICNRLRWQVDLLRLTGDDAVLARAPLGIDVSINEIFLPLVAGSRLVIAPPGAEGAPGPLLRIIREQSVTFCYVGTSLLEMLLDHPDAAAAGRTLRYVWCGGEVLGDELYRRFRERWNAWMFHGYGPAEATIGVCCRVFAPDRPAGRVSIGRPNPNTQVRVLDAEYNPVPVGAVGELYISGLPLARGYLGDPRRTADRFVPDPFAAAPGARMYATGDLARFRADGEIEFLGRADNQVKIRGFRVELAEIEQVLVRHPGVRQAAVALASGEDTPDELRAYWVRVPRGEGAPAGGPVGPQQLRSWLAQRLPAHMVPSVFVDVPGLPLAGSAGVDPIEPAPGLERRIAEVWSRVLGVDRVGARDDFFGLGGHSLALTRVQAQLEEHLGRPVRLRDLYAHTTVEDLAHVLGAASSAAVSAAHG
ncbi:Amino acid adenylation domain-containing protein [Frankia canadensis]|uniref:Amino acid adenylation domain-containing protein n=1 Tax=Frankia canadensis TaxID=1836972 RepID=A0A2I2KMU2_9ACTN|nr:non-ribosomal peptide synthetase [Frankia canadensis]SNQ46984.1 Amino acid adenylation domain-containing protein [Frankia canadensis]SOU54274.1 Amino acid adenylation domain-containing protein [Frankia canadensis]